MARNSNRALGNWLRDCALTIDFARSADLPEAIDCTIGQISTIFPHQNRG